MAEIKTIRLDSEQDAWLAAEALRAKVSQNRIIGALLDEARAGHWHFGAARPTPQHLEERREWA